jgi:asparagine synthase (glutamine-hydrolysing)
MCGIAAIFAHSRRAPPISQQELLAMRDRMAARGPDGAGSWVAADGCVGLAHRRLAIIDLSDAAAQPMVSARATTVLSFNGEIYNYRELRRELEQSGERFRTESDTEVILKLYEREGEDMLPRLRGMFAFALWDVTRRGLLLARDPMGIKPLYYSDDGDTLRLASQVHALLAAGIDGAPDPAGCVSFFLLGYVLEPFTIRQKIRALPAGHSLWIDERGVGTPRPFLSVNDALRTAESDGTLPTSAVGRECIHKAISESVSAHLVADVPVGIFLSAGLDSTSIAALAAASESGALRTLTLGFAEYRNSVQDEVPLAESVAHRLGVEHTTIWVQRADFLAARDRLFAAMDQPTTDGVNSYFVSQAAAQCGLKVAISGVGGDELFGGYPGFRQIPQLVRLLRPLGGLPWLGRGLRIVSSALIGRKISPKYAGLLEYGSTLEEAYLLRRALYMPWELPDVLDPEIVRHGWAALRPLLRFKEVTDGLDRDRTRLTALELAFYMRNQLLRDADWAGMAHSVEIRTPFVDSKLLRDLAPLLAGGQPPTKGDMARSTPLARMGDVLSRPKTGFTVPIRQWLLESTEEGTADRGLRGWAKRVFRHHVPA